MENEKATDSLYYTAIWINNRRNQIVKIMVILFSPIKKKGNNRSTYVVFSDIEECFDSLWLKDRFNEMKYPGYKSKDIKYYTN